MASELVTEVAVLGYLRAELAKNSNLIVSKNVEDVSIRSYYNADGTHQTSWIVMFNSMLNGNTIPFHVSVKIDDVKKTYEILCKTAYDMHTNSISQIVDINNLGKEIEKICKNMLCLNKIYMSGSVPKSFNIKDICISTAINIANAHMYTVFPNGFINHNDIRGTDYSRYSKYVSEWRDDIYVNVNKNESYGVSANLHTLLISSGKLCITRTINVNDIHGSREIYEAIISALNVMIQYTTI